MCAMHQSYSDSTVIYIAHCDPLQKNVVPAQLPSHGIPEYCQLLWVFGKESIGKVIPVYSAVSLSSTRYPESVQLSPEWLTTRANQAQRRMSAIEI